MPTEPKPVYHSGKVHIKAEKCETCIFRPGNLMHLTPGRVKDMVETSIAEGGGITCHKTLPYAREQAEQQATCRGFYDAHADRVPAFALAKAIGAIEEVP